MRNTAKEILSKRILFRWPEPARMKVRMGMTPSGWGFFGLILCALLMSINYSNNLIFAMTFLLSAIAMVSWYHTRVNVSGLVLGDWRSEPVFAGQNAVYQLKVENGSPSNRHGLLATSIESVLGSETHLAGNEQVEMSVKRLTSKRGRLKPVAAHIQSCFPLGIFRACMFTGQLPDCLVYPKPSGEQPISDHPIGRQAHLAAESGSYTDMRRYTPGDPLSHIHWKALARFDELYTKEFDGAQGHPAIWLRWEDVKATGVEQKLSQLCRWVLDAHSQNKEYGLEIPGTTIEPANEDFHLQNCLGALALYGESEQSA